MLRAPDAVAAVGVFRHNIGELDTEIAALSTIRQILQRMVERLRQAADVHVQQLITQDAELLADIATLSRAGHTPKEEEMMEQLDTAENALHKLSDVRILYLPPAMVAAVHCVCDEPEAKAGEIMDRFVRGKQFANHQARPETLRL